MAIGIGSVSRNGLYQITDTSPDSEHGVLRVTVREMIGERNISDKQRDAMRRFARQAVRNATSTRSCREYYADGCTHITFFVSGYTPDYTATYWEHEGDQPDGREGVYYITILDPEGEEYAVIMHRTCNGEYPLGGQVANEKLNRSLELCRALNAAK